MEEHSEYQYPVVLDESKQPANFMNIEDMLFEVSKPVETLLSDALIKVFRSEDSDEIDSIALGRFVTALENTGLRRFKTLVDIEEKLNYLFIDLTLV